MRKTDILEVILKQNRNVEEKTLNSKCVCVCVWGHILHKYSLSLIHSHLILSQPSPSLCCSLSQIESGDLPETTPDNHT